MPWLIHAPDARNRAPTRAETAAGLAVVPDLLARLPRLRAVMLCGRAAASAETLVMRHDPTVRVLRMPHPSPTYVCTDPGIAQRIVGVLTEAADAASDACAPRFTSI